MVICVPLASIVLEHLRAQERINFAVKVVGLALGTAFVRFFGWRSMNSEAAVQATSQGNRRLRNKCAPAWFVGSSFQHLMSMVALTTRRI